MARNSPSFLDTIFRYADRGTHISLRAFFDDRDGIFRIRSRKLNGDSRPLLSEIELFANDCAAASEAVVFCPPLATFTNPETADEKSLANGLALSVECDASPSAARIKLEALIGPATVIVASGGEWADPETGEIEPKLHLHWRLNEPTRSPEEHRLLKEARTHAARLIGGDPTNKPVIHPIRWPGSWHRKATPRLARIVSLTDHEIDLAETVERLQDGDTAPSPIRRPSEPGHLCGSGGARHSGPDNRHSDRHGLSRSDHGARHALSQGRNARRAGCAAAPRHHAGGT